LVPFGYLFEAIPRLAEPEMPQADGMLLLSIFGIAVNGYAAYKLSEGNSLNERVLNWHLLEDVLGWVAVFIVSIVLMFKPWAILDPILSIGFTLFILFNVIRNLKQTLMLFLQATPDRAQLERIRDDLLSNEHVSDLHHFHIWSLDGERNVMTVHLVLVGDVSTEHIQTLKNDVQHSLKKYNFEHTTVEFEFADEQCRDEA
tara:strand:- start:216 stop:818 length:603 start_codon:yes stop_codon:yes gene_type:complete